jgi:phosphonoacetaldehyde hydrolase
MIKGILFDFMGTTAIETRPDTIHQCFLQAFVKYGVPVTDAFIRSNRGRDKKEVIAAGLDYYTMPLDLAPWILESLNDALLQSLDSFESNEGAIELFEFLKSNEIKLGLGSGFPRDIFDLIFKQLEWQTEWFDFIGIAEETGRGRPHPDMIFSMVKQFNLSNEHFLKVGDTVADILEGKNAGVKTVAILSGTQDLEEINSYFPDFTIQKLEELKEIVVHQTA